MKFTTDDTYTPGLWPRYESFVSALFTPEEEMLLDQFSYWSKLIYTTADLKNDPPMHPYILFPIWWFLDWLYLHVKHETLTVRDLQDGFTVHASSLPELEKIKSEIREATDALASHLSLLCKQ